MKKIVMTILGGLFLLSGMATAQAVLIAPGVELPTLGQAPTAYGSVLASTGAQAFSFAGPSATTITGSVTSTVYDNVNLTGGLLFEYKIIVTSSGDNGIGKMTAYNFDGFKVDADYDPSKNNVGVNFPDEVENDSGTIYAAFDNSLSTGEYITFYIQTNANYYRSGGVSLIAAGSHDFNGFEPTATPEPATASLLGMGLLGLLRFRRKTTV